MPSTSYFCHILITLKILWTDFRETKITNKNFIKIRPVTAEFFHADGQTEEQTDGWTDRRTDGRDGCTDG
jgi:hypothetical protein